MQSQCVTVVIPVYNEEDSLKLLYERLSLTLHELQKKFEIIFINDGSTDNSLEILKNFYIQSPEHVRIIDFNRNYGQHLAIMAGFEHASGNIIVTMDADLQNHPEDIPLLIDKINEGYDVVGGYRENRQDKYWRISVSRMHNWLRQKLTYYPMRDEGCMLRAYTEDIVKRMVQCQEHSTFVSALALNFAQNPTEIPIKHSVRSAGKSKYNFYKLVRYNFDFIANFSKVPLELLTLAGGVVILSSLVFLLVLFLRTLMYSSVINIVFILFGILYFLIGALLMGLGIVGEYIGRIQMETRKRPRFVIRRLFGNIDL